MLRMARITVVCFVNVALMGGCLVVNTAETRNLQTTNQPFQRALYVQYAELALRELEEGNTTSAEVFDRKARAAAAGNVLPIPSIQDISSTDKNLPALLSAQEMLQKYLNDKASLKMPVESARAQAMLDCWIEEQGQGVDAGDIAACRQAFERAISVLKDNFTAL